MGKVETLLIYAKLHKIETFHLKFTASACPEGNTENGPKYHGRPDEILRGNIICQTPMKVLLSAVNEEFQEDYVKLIRNPDEF